MAYDTWIATPSQLGSWNTPANWSAGVPTDDDDVNVNAAALVSSDANSVAGSITIFGSLTGGLTAGSAIVETNGFLQGDAALSFGSLANYGEIEATQGSFTDTGNFYNPGHAEITTTSGSIGGNLVDLGLFDAKAPSGGAGVYKVGGDVYDAGFLDTGAFTTFTVGGFLDLAAGGDLDIEGDFIANGGSRLVGTVDGGTGTLELAGGLNLIESGAKMTQGGLSITGSSTVVALLEILGFGGKFTLGVGARINIAAGDLLGLGGISDGNASIAGLIGGGGQIQITGGTTTLASGGGIYTSILSVIGLETTLKIDETATYSGLFQLTAGATLAIDAGDVFVLNGSALLDSATVNGLGRLATAGVISFADTSVASVVSNTGSIDALSGTTDFQAAVNGTGKATILSTATLEFDGSVSGQTIGFTGSGGKLDINALGTFAGVVSDIAADDTISVASPWTFLGFTENAAHTQGALSFSNGASQASVTLLGDYTGSFHAAVSGGATQITYTA